MKNKYITKLLFIFLIFAFFQNKLTALEINITPTFVNICQDCLLTFTANVKDGTPPYNFIWQGPDNFVGNAQTITIEHSIPANSGTYKVTVTDSLGNQATASSNARISFCSFLVQAVRVKYCDSICL